MPSCVVFGCSENTDNQKGSEVHFHRFPNREKSPERHAQWVAFCRRKKFTPTKNSWMCSKHFKKSDYDPSYLLKKSLMPNEKFKAPQLLPRAVPTITVDKEFETGRAKRYEIEGRNRVGDHFLLLEPNPGYLEDAEVDPDDPDPIPENSGLSVEENVPENSLVEETANESNFVESMCFVNTDIVKQLVESSDSEIEEDSVDFEEEKHVFEKCNKQFDYFLVSWLSILQLFEVCISCQEKVTNVQRFVNGTGLMVKSVCDACGAERNWNSQQTFGERPEGNVVIAAVLLLSGVLFSSYESLCSVMKIPSISHTTFYKILHTVVAPFVNKIWADERQNNLNALKSSPEPIWMAGDSQSDSSSYSAKYCTYSAMDVRTKKIIDFELVRKGQSSGALERIACEKLVNKLVKDEKCDIKLFLTDGHNGVRQFLRNEHPKIVHEFDVWHLSKSLMKKFEKYEKFPNVQAWRASVINHLWWCAQAFGGDGQLLRDNFTDIIYHITDRHSWEKGCKTKKCGHKPLSEKEICEKLWIKVGSQDYQILKKIIFNKKFLKDIVQVKNYVHAGSLESYRNLRLNYVPKRTFFSYDEYYLRSIISILDFNANVEKKEVGEKLQYLKRSGRWILKTRYSSADDSWKKRIVNDILAGEENNPAQTTRSQFT